MIPVSVYVYSLSKHAFTGAVNARQARVPTDLHCNKNRLQTTTVNCLPVWLSWVSKSQHIPSTCVAHIYLTHVHFTDKRALHWHKLVLL
jgi:hypothetical protein